MDGWTDGRMDGWIDGYVNKKSTRKRVFSCMRIFITAESISTTFCTFTPWVDVVTYFNRHQN